jgi:hypothetical protein
MLSAPLPISALTAVQLPNDVTAWRTLHAVQLQSSASSSAVVWQVDIPPTSPSAKNTPPQDEHSHHAKGTQSPPLSPPPPLSSASQRSSGLRYWSNSAQQWIANADQTYAQQLANMSSTASVQVEKITTFKGEYGFINKRLPVWRVYDGETQTTRYIETSTGRLALETHQSDRIEGLIFANFHKWQFLGDSLNKDWRDSLQALGAALVMLLTVLGVWLYVRRRIR